MQNPPIESNPPSQKVLDTLRALAHIEREKTFWCLSESGQFSYTGSGEQYFAENLRCELRRFPEVSELTALRIRDYIHKTLNNPPEET